MMDIDSMIAVLQAAKAGKQIQSRLTQSNLPWVDAFPLWDFWYSDYRVKPEPREWWFVKSIGVGPSEHRYGWERHDVKQKGVDYLEQVHVREVLE